jgi:hypothetical protein
MSRLAIVVAYSAAAFAWIYVLPDSPALRVGAFVLVNTGLGAAFARIWTLPLAGLFPLLALPRLDDGSSEWAYWLVLAPAAAALIAFGLGLRRLAERDLGGEPQSQRS